MRATILAVMIFATGLANASEPPRMLDVFVLPNGNVAVNKAPSIAFSKFKKKMEPLLRRKACVPVTIHAESGTSFEALGRVIILLAGHQQCRVGFIAEPSAPPN